VYLTSGKGLTEIEKKVLDLYTELGSQKLVAERIHRSDSTVSKTVERARRKIMSSRETIIEARKRGYLDLLGIPDV
jgi:DNA-binding CsgD family transcriptional regulator